MAKINLNDREDHSILSTGGRGDTFADILRVRLSRRNFFKAAAVTTAAAAVRSSKFTQLVLSANEPTANYPLGFTPLAGNSTDRIDVPPGHTTKVLIRWGDPVLPGGPEFDPTNQTAAAQAMQFGYNCDFVGYFPYELGSQNADKGLLVVNHEYTTQEIMFPNYDIETTTQEQVDIEMAAHGVSIIEIEKKANGEWEYKPNSSFNRRLTLSSDMIVTGPAAGHKLLKTSTDTTGVNVSGTLNNCSGGKTPWGTVLTAEENFQLYFGNRATMPEGEIKDLHTRYGLEANDPRFYRWLDYYDRFDLLKEPNEPFRFGWVVEVDPYDPTWTPRKRTGLGRFRHEAATVHVTPNGQVVIYSGDDQRFEYMYKFVTRGTYDPNDRLANRDSDLLSDGTLYAAKFNDNGTGEWLPLVYGKNGLEGTIMVSIDGEDKQITLNSQADVLAKTRLAADFLGATRMDRPEDIETNPVTGKVYVALTNNSRRTEDNTDAANPQAPNTNGHILELTEDNNDHTSTSFTWEIFLICGRAEDNNTVFAGFPKDKLNNQFSGIAAPDNLTFDDLGNLWVTTDGQPSSSRLELNDGIFAIPVEGAQRGHIGQFLCSVVDSEVCGPEFALDYKTLFLAIQHPGDGSGTGTDSSYENPTSRWPDFQPNMPPRPSVIAIQTFDLDGHVGNDKVGQLSEPYRNFIPVFRKMK